ncbi:hypothetical protein GCM10022223_50650 [Kineosporia mesophila]|uniref:Uncharacterized protein n=1 Tax=Kineosporia mesophila TaxID=566012 RepID=A0ABP7A8Y1_9ACTN|nr:hypothetical protein [Kineosporia mesophila]MCD5354638.1 hypothetical protein [Kineosporia mesophila]
MMAIMEHYTVTAAGVELEVEQPGTRTARILRDGQEIPRDQHGTWHFTGADGQAHRLQMGTSVWRSTPMMHVDDRREDTVYFRPRSPWWLIAHYAGFFFLYPLALRAGLLSLLLLMPAYVLLNVLLWRSMHRGNYWRHGLAALLVLVVSSGLYVWFFGDR